MTMPLQDHTAAELARLEAIEAAPAAPESWEATVERVARTIWEADCGAVSYEWVDVSEGGRSKWRRYAAAALAALRPEPTR